jgi:hypothetical protein
VETNGGQKGEDVQEVSLGEVIGVDYAVEDVLHFFWVSQCRTRDLTFLSI